MDVIWTELGRILGLIGVGIFLLYADRLKTRLTEWFKNRRLNPVARAVMTCRAIVDRLVELRVTLGAARCYVMQFHNGQIFSTQNPVYRMSCTQEACGRGLQPLQGAAQNILVEQAWREIELLFTGELMAGVACAHREETPAKPPYRATYYYVAQDLDEGWFKLDLISRAACAVAISPVLDGHGTLVGFVAAEFNNAEQCRAEHPPEGLYRVTHAAANIWYELERHASRR